MIRKAMAVVLWRSPTVKHWSHVLLLRTVASRGSYWQPVTGKVEDGESFLEGGLREAEEETGLRFAAQPQFLGLDYSFIGRWGPARERAYVLYCQTSITPPTIKIDPKEHQEYQWTPFDEALALVPHDSSKESIRRATQWPAPLYLSSRGELFQEGEAITHERTLQLLKNNYKAVTDLEGKISLNQEHLNVYCEDSSQYITSFDLSNATLSLWTGAKISFQLENLEIRNGNSLYFKTDDSHWAKFISSAYHSFAQLLEKDNENQYFLPWNGTKQRINAIDKSPI